MMSKPKFWPRKLLVNVLLLLISMGAYGAEARTLANPTGKPIGGGEGYGLWVDKASATIVSDKASLKLELARANYGDVIYVDDSKEIDLSNEWNIPIPAGVTLASGRGRNGSLGALLFTNSMPEVTSKQTLFRISGADVRITGLRIKGPSIYSEQYDTGEPCERNEPGAIHAEASSVQDWKIQVDNNEVWGWPDSAISLHQVRNSHIHHNYLHHNRRHEKSAGCKPHGLGYGVVTHLGDALIEANIFSHNRHDIASTGKPGSSYEARYNLVVEGLLGHSFDMHGCPDTPNDWRCRNNPRAAGETIYIHNNTFLHSNHNAIVIRGVPTDRADIDDNRFSHAREQCDESVVPRKTGGICQRYFTGNLFANGNQLGRSPLSMWFISFGGSDLNQLRAFSNFNPAQLKTGDFDGDGAQDIFTANGSTWNFSASGRHAWKKLGTSSVKSSDLRLGDFDGDGRTDIFTTFEEGWYISWGAVSPWEKISTHRDSLSELRFGDFDGDGLTDVFRTSGGVWYVSWGARTAWNRVGSSAAPLENLRFEDFTGDGKTDVLWASHTKWRLSRGAANPWEALWQHSTGFYNRIDELRFCDFNGDGRTDVFRASDKDWLVSFSGKSVWTKINGSIKDRNSPDQDRQFELNNLIYDINNLALGDFNGDGSCDVMMKRVL